MSFFHIERYYFVLRFEQDAQHAAQWLSSAPQELVTDGERAQVVIAHGHFVQATHGHSQGACDGGRCQVTLADFAHVRHHFDPVIRAGQDAFDLVHGHVFFQLDGQAL